MALREQSHRLKHREIFRAKPRRTRLCCLAGGVLHRGVTFEANTSRRKRMRAKYRRHRDPRPIAPSEHQVRTLSAAAVSLHTWRAKGHRDFAGAAELFHFPGG